jgi:hypothetical protein
MKNYIPAPTHSDVLYYTDSLESLKEVLEMRVLLSTIYGPVDEKAIRELEILKKLI